MPPSKPLRRRVFLTIATVFGVSSTLQSFGLAWLRQGQAMPEMLPHLLVANMLYWWVPALLAPLIMAFAERLRQRGVPWKQQALVHTAVALGYLAGPYRHDGDHQSPADAGRAAPGLVEVLSGRLPLAARLAADDVSASSSASATRWRTGASPKRARSTRAQLETRLVAGAAPGAPAAAASALPLQHAEHDLGPDAHRRRRGRSDDRSAGRPAAHDAAHLRHARRSRSSRSSSVLQKYLDIEQTRFGDRAHA